MIYTKDFISDKAYCILLKISNSIFLLVKFTFKTRYVFWSKILNWNNLISELVLFTSETKGFYSILKYLERVRISTCSQKNSICTIPRGWRMHLDRLGVKSLVPIAIGMRVESCTSTGFDRLSIKARCEEFSPDSHRDESWQWRNEGMMLRGMSTKACVDILRLAQYNKLGLENLVPKAIGMKDDKWVNDV